MKRRPRQSYGEMERVVPGRGSSNMTTAQPAMPAIDFTQIGPRVGDRFPDVVLPNQNGTEVDLHAARAGRRALVVFHRSAGW